jgi:GT2 family glycosyltransferase/glycosyltransferase involved in cell wall biosynthesis
MAHRRTHLPDFLILGQEKWDQVERRNQLLIRALATRNPTARFVFAERALRPRQIREWRWPRPVQVAANIWTVQLIRPLSDRISPRLSDKAEARQVARAARLAGLDRPYLWTQDPHAADLLGLLQAEALVYDLTDDWAAFESSPERRLCVQAQIDKLARAADVVLACSARLCQAAERAGARVQPVYLPNAIDGLAVAGPVPVELAGLPRPRLGYAGTLHGSRLDVDLLVEAAALRPQWSFVFLGPDLLEPRDRSRLFAASNVHHLGTRPHAEVARYVSGFDVALVPNRVTDFTESLDPLKTYEYLAAGVPVVATPAGVSPELAAHVNVVSTPATLIANAERLIASDNSTLVAARRALVVGQTWDARATVVEGTLGLDGSRPATTGISVVIVSFNTRELLRGCLASLREQDRQDVHTIVVDNRSTDGSQAMVRTEFPEVELLESEENLGFAKGNNAGFVRCTGEFVLLLNSDAFPHTGAITAMVDAARRHPGAAVIGPRLLNSDGTLQRSAWPFPDPTRLLLEAVGLHRILRRTPFFEDLGTWNHDEERRVDFLAGACLLLRATALAEVGGFDERFYMYAEEADLQRRMRARGWSVMLTPTAVVTHVGGASATGPASRLSQFYGGQLRFLRKHRGGGAVAIARISLLIGSVLRRRWASARIAVTAGRLDTSEITSPWARTDTHDKERRR